MVVHHESREYEVVDFHVHPKVLPSGRLLSPSELIAAMDEAGVDKAVLLAVETSPEGFDDLVGEDEKLRTGLEYYRLQGRRDVYWLDEGLLLYEFTLEVKQLLELLKTPSEAVESYVNTCPGRFIGFGSLNPHAHPSLVEERVRSIKEHGLKGIKLLPTIQFFNPADPKMDVVYEAAERQGLVLLIHTGCDPGPWEVVEFSSNANPRHLAAVAERYPDLSIVMAHMGSYSALEPGIWFNEAVALLRRFENVYADTSAIDERLVKAALDRGVPEDKLIYGSDYPAVSHWCDLSTGMGNPVKALLSLEISSEAKEKMLSLNAKRLLSL